MFAALVCAFVTPACTSDLAPGHTSDPLEVGLRAQPTLIASGQGAAFGIAVDGTNVYWTTSTVRGAVRAAPLAGGEAPRTLTSARAPRRLRVVGENVFYSETGAGVIARVARTGGPVTKLATGQKNPMGIALGASAVFWTNAGSDAQGYEDGSVMSTALVDGVASPPVAVAEDSAMAMGLDVNSKYVYWTTINDKSVRRRAVGGGPIEVVATNQQSPSSLAVDEHHAYWVNSDTGTLMAASVSDNTVRVLASDQVGPTSLATDGEYVYWSNRGPGGQRGSIMKVAVREGAEAPVALATSQLDPVGVAVDHEYVYWTDYTLGLIQRVAK